MSYTIKEFETIEELEPWAAHIGILSMSVMETFEFDPALLKLKLAFYLNQGGRIVLAFKDDELVGCMLASITYGIFDHRKIFNQDLFFVEPGHPKAAHLLFRDFIDFGKSHAEHVVTMIGDTTNIKPRSLERLGFKRTEVTYNLET